MKIKNNTQKNNYFELRNISNKTYLNYKLPKWIYNELTDKNIYILDYGCGFGQILKTLKQEQFNNIYGIDIEKNAIDECLKSGLNVKELNIADLQNPFDIKFDVIILSHVIEHIPKEQIIDTLKTIKLRFFKRGGEIAYRGS